MNLYKELEEKLDIYNKTINDIKWISVSYDIWNEEKNECVLYFYGIDINNFIDIAKKTNYDNGYGGTEIPIYLIIAGDNWWLERNDYDGSEWFEFKRYPPKPNIIKTINKIRYLDCEEE